MVMTLILPLSGKKMTALPRQEDVDVAEAATEAATVVTVATIITGNVEDIEEATVTVEDTEEAIVEDTVEVTAEANEATSEASEVANEEESVVATVAVAVENGGVIMMESVDEVEAVDEVIEEVVMDRLRVLQRLQFLHDCLTAQSTEHYLPQNSRTLSIYLIYSRSFFLMILYCVNIVLHRYPVSLFS